MVYILQKNIKWLFPPSLPKAFLHCLNSLHPTLFDFAHKATVMAVFQIPFNISELVVIIGADYLEYMEVYYM